MALQQDKCSQISRVLWERQLFADAIFIIKTTQERGVHLHRLLVA